MVVLSLLLAAQAAHGLSLADAAREAVARSPEVAAAKQRAAEMGLEEPLLLANTDPYFQGSFRYSDDRAPRAAPLFQGSRARQELWDAAIAGNTLLGTEARLGFHNERLVNPTPFRALDPSVDSSLTLSVSQPLLRYFWGRPDKARRRRARSRVAAAAADLRAAHEFAAGRAAAAYLELWYAGRQEAIRVAGVEDARRLLEKYEEKRRYGLVEASDLLQAKASLEAQEIELELARSEARRAATALAAALQKLGGALPPLEAPGPLPDPPAEEEGAVEARSDLASIRAQRESLEWAARVENLDTLPELTASVSYGVAGLNTDYRPSWSDLGTFDHAVKTAGLAVRVPFFFKKERLTRRGAALRLEGAKAEEARLLTEARRQSRDSRERWRLARRRAEAHRKLLDLEKRKFAAEEENFRRGRSSTDLLLRFQQDIRRAESQLLRAEVDEVQARLEAARAGGTLLEVLGL